MSPFGHEDYGISQEREIVHAVTDLGELATRLGSPDTYSRSGNVVMLDSFEDGIGKWFQGLAGGGASIALSGAQAKSGAFSALLVAPAIVNNYVFIQRGLGLLTNSSLGLEGSFCYLDTGARLEGYLVLYDGTEELIARYRYTPGTGVLEIITTGSAWTTVATNLFLDLSLYLFHTIKLVIDPATKKYKRLFVNANSYNVSTVSLLVSADTTYPAAYVGFEHYSLDGANHNLYIDDIIGTQNEP